MDALQILLQILDLDYWIYLYGSKNSCRYRAIEIRANVQGKERTWRFDCTWQEYVSYIRSFTKNVALLECNVQREFSKGRKSSLSYRLLFYFTCTSEDSLAIQLVCLRLLPSFFNLQKTYASVHLVCHLTLDLNRRLKHKIFIGVKREKEKIFIQ